MIAVNIIQNLLKINNSLGRLKQPKIPADYRFPPN